MKMSLTAVRRRQDGSIDTDFYVALGNRERGRAIRAFCTRVFGRARAADRRSGPAHRNFPRPGQIEQTEEI